MNIRKSIAKNATSIVQIKFARHLIAACFLLGGLLQPALADSRDPCGSSSPLLLNGVDHVYRNSPEDDDYFRLDVPRAGVLTLEVSAAPQAAGGAAMRPMIAWLGSDCSLHGRGPADGLERPPAWYVMKVETPGTYFFAVVAGVSGARRDFRPGFYTLRTGFAAAEPLPREDLAAKEIDPWESDPISLCASVPEPCRGAGSADKEIDPWESDPISLLAPSCRAADLLALHRLCDLAKRGDHGDLLACARGLPLGARVLSELGPEDLDTFSFLLTARREVVLETSGETDTHGELLDARGHRLAVDDDSGAGVNFRIVATLEPGRYFLRVEAVEAPEGSYVLETRISLSSRGLCR